ncbi:MAG: ATP-dependent sacrificial sulfur transferase LarE [Candidatus Margulisiibacteriota bacterium]
MDIKLAKLKDILRGTGSVLLAFSGGVDSTFLLKAALDVLGQDKVLAVIAVSETYPASEKQQAQELGEKLGVKTLVIETRELDNESFRRNPQDRCYFCKSELFSRLNKIADEKGLAQVIDGSNVDDLSDFRPGAKAKKELGIRSPLQEAGLTKQEIRDLSRSLGLPTWDKPSYACLASRIPYGTRIEPETLIRLDEAEKFLRTLGFKQLRVRHHGNLARIELEEKDIPKVLGNGLMDKINNKFATLGYIYVTIDLKGYRTGSLNEALI